MPDSHSEKSSLKHSGRSIVSGFLKIEPGGYEEGQNFTKVLILTLPLESCYIPSVLPPKKMGLIPPQMVTGRIKGYYSWHPAPSKL